MQTCSLEASIDHTALLTSPIYTTTRTESAMHGEGIARMDSNRSMIVSLWTLALVCAFGSADAWVQSLSHPCSSALGVLPKVSSRTALFADTSTSLPGTSVEEDDEDEYEYVEYDALTEAEFVGSEWLVGTNWDRSSDKIEETWVRLVVSEEGKNMCYWGDNSEGKWSLDVASQFLSISKESFFGKQIWAGVVEDYYFLQGTVRGWTYLMPASVLAQWQARRLGVDKEEAGVAPWFQTDDDGDAVKVAEEEAEKSD